LNTPSDLGLQRCKSQLRKTNSQTDVNKLLLY